MQRVSTVDKCLDLLEAILNADEEGGGIRELSRRTGINPTTVHNICATLCTRGYLRQDPGSRRFRLGTSLWSLGQSDHARQALAERARTLVRRCQQELDESILLAVIEHAEISTLVYLPSAQALRVHEPRIVGERAYGTAFGKVLLATFEEDQLERYFQQSPPRQFTEATMTDTDRIREELSRVRDRGYAITRDELVNGASAVAVPILNRAGVTIAALGASAPTVRMDAAQAELTRTTLTRFAALIAGTWFENVDPPARST